jgi:sugar phosphate isomerase/epimerase
MNEPIRKYCKLGIVHFMAFPQCMGGEGPILETVRVIAEDPDYDVIEMGRVKDPEVRKQVTKMVEEAGLTFGYAAQPAVLGRKLNTNALDETERNAAVTALKEEIDIAKEMKAVGCAFLSGKDPGPEKRAAASDAFVKSVQALCDHAGSLPVICETFDRDIDKKALVGPTTEAVEICKRVGRKNFGLMLDLSHLPLLHEKSREALTTARAVLFHAHMGNCLMSDPQHPVYGDYHPRFGFPGGENGVPELTEYLRALLEIGYLDPKRRPILSFEVKPQAGEDGRVVMANSKRALAAAWAAV